MRKLILYIAASLDGYIAQPGDDLSFLGKVYREDEDYGYGEFIQTVDTVILGRKTYDWVLGQGVAFPHADKETYVITRKEQDPQGLVRFYTGDITALVHQLKAGSGKHIFCDGGAALVHELFRLNLIDDIILSLIPVMVGDGISLFKDGRPFTDLELVDCRKFESGLVQLHYRCIPGDNN